MSSDLFHQFWSFYPRRVARAAAQKAFFKALESASFDEILKGVQAFQLHVMSEDTPAKFIPHASSWLHQGRYADEYNLNLPQRKEPEVYPGETMSAALRRRERTQLKVV